MNQDELQNIDQESNNQSKRTSHDTNRIMGMAAIFISVLSMFAVIYQSYLAREENELMRIQQSATVLPYLDSWYSNIEEKHKVVIANKGVGPAFIKEVKFMGMDVKSKDTIFFKSSHGLYGFITKQSAFLDSIPAVKASFYANTLLSAGEERELYIFSFDNQDQEKRFSKEFYKYYVGFKVIYEDVYGTRWVYHSKKGYPVKLKGN